MKKVESQLPFGDKEQRCHTGDELHHERALKLVSKIDKKFRPVWENRPSEEQAALAFYFLPHRSKKHVLGPTRPRVVKWYCPFANQTDFSSGHRYCINVYTGCGHKCTYCYAAGYEPQQARCKNNFERMIAKDMEDLEHFDVPPAPVHLSNSTDPFQALEATAGHTRAALEHIVAHRNHFTTVTLLTKNPLLPVRLGYVDLLKKLMELPSAHAKGGYFSRNCLPGLRVEVSIAFWREEAREVYDPSAPSIVERIEGIRALREAGIPLVLRIDPLFPRSSFAGDAPLTLSDFGLMEAQTLDDLEALVSLAKENEVMHVVYSVAKITQPRGRELSETMQAMRKVYRHIASLEKLVFRGGSWRLPRQIATEMIVQPFLDICKRHNVPAKHCKQNLIQTP